MQRESRSGHRRFGSPYGGLQGGGEVQADAEPPGRKPHGPLEPVSPLVVADGVVVFQQGRFAGIDRVTPVLVLEQQP